MIREELSVSLAFHDHDVVRVGRLAVDERGIGVLEYAPEFIALGISLNPYSGRPSSRLVRSENPRETENLPGVLADSLPDAWGRLLIERRLRDRGVWRGRPSGFEQLAIVGRRGRGALIYEPAIDDVFASISIGFDELAADAERVISGDESVVVEALATLGGTSGGARPKINVALDAAGHARPSGKPLQSGFTDWLVKFSSSADEVRDAVIVEAAYARAAEIAGIAMPRTRLIRSPAGRAYFATERFDRTPDGGRRHMVSAAGALEIAWAEPNITYDNLFALTRAITRDERDVREMFRRMVFNVLAHNRDDHAKQHSFLMNRDGEWHVSPAYDLTFSRGPGGQHYALVNGKGSVIRRADLLAEAREQSLPIRDAMAIISQVAGAVRLLPSIARELRAHRDTIGDLRRATEATLEAAIA